MNHLDIAAEPTSGAEPSPSETARPVRQEGAPAPVVRRYEGPRLTVTYDARRCIHAAECIRSLPAVFDRKRRPWIAPQADCVDATAAVIQRCPSGALHYARSDGGPAEAAPDENTVVPTPDGPLYVRGQVELRGAGGGVIVEDVRLALCRCGQSENKPFCDNSHRGSGFDDAGTVADGGSAEKASAGLTITATRNGPLLVEGALRIRSANGQGCFLTARVELCRCGHSSNKPFCDGTHERIGFRGE